MRAERGSDVIIVLVGNKTDLVDKRQVGAGGCWVPGAGSGARRRLVGAAEPVCLGSKADLRGGIRLVGAGWLLVDGQASAHLSA